MSISLGFSVEVLPESTQKQIRSLASVRVWPSRRDTQEIEVQDLESNSPIELLRIVSDSNARVGSWGFALDRQIIYRGDAGRYAWRPEASWVAAELIPDETCYLDDSNVFEPQLPDPCKGLVAPGHPVRIVEKPAGHVCSAGEDTIVSDRMLQFLERYCDTDTSPVIYRGKQLPNWHRLRIVQRLPVIAEEALYEFNCLACGVRGAATPGSHVIFGHRTKGLAVCENTTGLEHGRIVPVFILSVEVATELEKTIGTGYALTPILDVDTPIGQRVVELLKIVQKLPKLPQD